MIKEWFMYYPDGTKERVTDSYWIATILGGTKSVPVGTERVVWGFRYVLEEVELPDFNADDGTWEIIPNDIRLLPCDFDAPDVHSMMGKDSNLTFPYDSEGPK